MLICPTITDDSMVNKSIPFRACQPAKTANEAPAKPISDRVWVKNDIRPGATNTDPITPDTIAMKVEVIRRNA